MSSEDRRAREQSAVRERILNAARDLFLRDGYESVSLRKVAEAIEYTPPALYTHFADKAELLRALCRRDFGALTEVSLRMAAIDDPLERVQRLGATYIRFAVEYPHHYRFMFMTRHPPEVEPDPSDLAEKDNPERNSYALLRAAIQQAIDQGRLRPEYRDAEMCAQLLWSAVHGVASLQVTMGDDPWVEWRDLGARTRLMCQGLLRGMMRDPDNLGPWPGDESSARVAAGTPGGAP